MEWKDVGELGGDVGELGGDAEQGGLEEGEVDLNLVDNQVEGE